jgi:translation elongation factor EF-Tu-like GTPase
MFTGASNTDLAIILIDARNGITDQTKRHSIISSILGIPHVLICVNKMDLKNYDQAVFESIKQDFFDYQSNEKFDLVTCFQVLEHVPNPKEFANKLLALAKTLVVSVPYQWPEGKCKWHIHDPVSEDKLADWFSKAPKFSYICRELNGIERLIQVYQ